MNAYPKTFWGFVHLGAPFPAVIHKGFPNSVSTMDARFTTITTSSGVSVFEFAPAGRAAAAGGSNAAAPSKPAKAAAGAKTKAAGGAGGSDASSSVSKSKDAAGSKADASAAAAGDSQAEGPKVGQVWDTNVHRRVFASHFNLSYVWFL